MPPERKYKNIYGKRYHLSGRYETKEVAEREAKRIVDNHPFSDLYTIKTHVTRETSHPQHYGPVHYAVWTHFPPERAKYFGHLTTGSKAHRAGGKQ